MAAFSADNDASNLQGTFKYNERKVFEMYDDNKDGVLETITAGKMLMDLYRSMNKQFHPTATDIASFARIFDRENKGKITFEDMEKFALKYYCNEDY